MSDRTYSTLRIAADGDSARLALADAAETLARPGSRTPRLRVILGSETLSAATIAALISALRKLREIGGAIELAAERETVQAVIRLNGLDRVFAFPLGEAGDGGRTSRKPRRPWHVVRDAAAACVVVLMLAFNGAAANADGAPAVNPQTLLAQVMERNPNLSSYQSRLHVDIKLISFPFLAQHLDGSTYFKRPANYEVVFDRVPAYAKGFEKLYSDVGDPANWNARFNITYAGERPFENRTDIALHMVQRVRGMIDHETVLIDPTAFTIDQIRYDYYNGGVVTMTQHFADVGGYTMLTSQIAEIRIPHVHAVAHGSYTEYQTNVAISDSVFTKKN